MSPLLSRWVTRLSLSPSTFWFLVVGGSAALTHMLVFALVRDQMRPELANALGFVVAFFVSFAGHRWLSFRDTNTSVSTSLGRFVVTALAGFVSNELVFVLLLRLAAWPVLQAWADQVRHQLAFLLPLPSDWTALLALVIALVFAAGQTFVLSRFWAFRR